jgi:hypothetical protein
LKSLVLGDKLWAGEAEDRLDAYDQGRIKAISLESVDKVGDHFLEIAQKELDDAIDYYNHEVHGLGDARPGVFHTRLFIK